MHTPLSDLRRHGWLRSVPFAVVCVLATTSVLAVTPPPSSSHPTSAKLTAVNGIGKTIEVRVNGIPGTFLFDSGWGTSAITPETATRIGCVPWGQITGFRAIGERVDMMKCNAAKLQIADVTFPVDTLGVIDLMKFMPEGTSPLNGGIGLNVFAGRQITIQSRGHRLVIETPDSLAKRVKGAHAIPIRLVRDAGGLALSVSAGLPTSAGMVWMELDTGNNSGTHLIGKHVAALLGLKADMKEPQQIHRDIVPGVSLTGEAVVSDLIMDGNIGATFLDQWDLTLDLKAEKGWLAPAQP